MRTLCFLLLGLLLVLARPAWAALTGDAYFPFASLTEGNTTRTLVESAAPFDGIVSQLRCRVAAANDSDEAWTITLYVNGVASVLTCTIGVSAQTCTDLGNTVPVTTGQRLAYFADNTAGASPSATPTCTAVLYEYR